MLYPSLHKDNAYYRGKEIAERLKEIIPRQLFEVAIQRLSVQK